MLILRSLVWPSSIFSAVTRFKLFSFTNRVVTTGKNFQQAQIWSAACPACSPAVPYHLPPSLPRLLGGKKRKKFSSAAKSWVPVKSSCKGKKPPLLSRDSLFSLWPWRKSCETWRHPGSVTEGGTVWLLPSKRCKVPLWWAAAKSWLEDLKCCWSCSWRKCFQKLDRPLHIWVNGFAVCL